MSYADITGHASMAFDSARNTLYAAAIRRIITPDSVVLDLGAGLGIHGLLAAQAGARRVFLVEPEAVVLAAEEVARSNGFGDRVSAFRGRIEEVDLPEKVDVIISVFTGNLLFSEDLLPSLYHARDKWLKPGGVLLPDAAQLLLAPVSAPRTHSDVIGQWSQPHFGIDYSAVRRYAPNNILHSRGNSFRPQMLAIPQTVVNLDLMRTHATDCDVETSVTVTLDADCSGLLAWIRMRLGDQWLGTGPDDPDVHWTPGFLPLDPELPVQAGDHLAMRLRRPAYGEYTWQVAAPSGQRRHSTFLGQPHALADLRKYAEDYAPVPGARGEAALHVLRSGTGGRSNGVIADDLAREFPKLFASRAAALEFVRELAARYAK